MEDNKKLIERLVLDLLRQGGSDLHISGGRHPVMRVNGELITLLRDKELTNDDVKGVIEAMIGKDKLNKFIEKQEIDFSYSVGTEARLRGNAYVTRGNISIALRLIPKVKPLDELDLPPILKTFATKKQGFFLIVGPVGQGKSTTMAAMIDLINTERAERIITIEDPIEYLFDPKSSIIDQREVGIYTEDFQTALNSVFREDVNVIMIGEMRNAETIATAVTAAETGHLVISTLHTNNASQTIDRIIDSFPPEQQDQIRTQLAGSLLGIFSQRLIPKTTGGRVPAYELLINNNAVSNLIRERRTHEIEVVIETGFEQGMVDMNRSLLDLVRKGEITIDNARLYSSNPKGLERLM